MLFYDMIKLLIISCYKIKKEKPEDIFRFKIDIRIDEDQVRAIGLQHILDQQIAGSGNHRTPADAANLNANPMLPRHLGKRSQRYRQLQGDLEVIRGESDEEPSPR